MNLWNKIPIIASKNKQANMRGIFKRYPASKILKARPDSEPPLPAANSATIAPISESPADTFNPATTLGIELGTLRWTKVLNLEALYNLNKSIKSALIEFKPKIEFVKTGKNATNQTQISNATFVLST